MLIKTIVILAGFSAISTIALAQYRLDIEITGFRNDKGAMMLQLFDENHQVIDEKKEFIKDGKCSLIIGELKAGKYALKYFHDENLSGNLETDQFGKPTEGYGFSNNVTGKFGPPSFEKWIFEVNADKIVKLELVY